MNKSNFINSTISLKQLMICAMGLLLYQGMSAQQSSELSIHVKGQFSKLVYDYSGGTNDMQNGHGIGLNYAYYLNDNWSLGTGVEYQNFNSDAYLENLEGSSMTVDSEGEAFEFRYTASGYVEDQTASFINIPLKVQYETSKSVGFYAAGGVKVGINMNADYDYRALELTTSGYYEQYDAELNDPKFIGFGEFGTYEGTSEFDLDTNFILNLETGIKLETGYDQNLYVGLFLDYGLNDLKQDNDQTGLFGYNAQDPISFENGGLLSSKVDEIKTIAFGLKVRYAMKL